jgi:hypothetical protein
LKNKYKKSTIIRKHRFIKKASLMHLIFKNMATRGGAMGVSSFPSSASCFRKNGLVVVGFNSFGNYLFSSHMKEIEKENSTQLRFIILLKFVCLKL